MTILDIVLIAVVLGAAVYGFRRGIIHQLGSLGGVVLGVILCRLFGSQATELVATLLGHDPDLIKHYVDSIIAYVALFAIAYFLVELVAKWAVKVTKALSLGVFDRIAGVVYSVFLWVFAFSIALNIWQCFASYDIASKSSLNSGRAIRGVLELAPDVLSGKDIMQPFKGE